MYLSFFQFAFSLPELEAHKPEWVLVATDGFMKPL